MKTKLIKYSPKTNKFFASGIIGKITLLSAILFSSSSFAQGEFVAEEMFITRYPSAKSEAMGRNSLADNGSPYAIFFNPAGIIGDSEFSVTGAFSSPYYLLIDAKYYFGAGTWNFNDKSAVGFAAWHMDDGKSYHNGDKYVNGTTWSKYSLSFAHEFFESFNLGINANYIVYKSTLTMNQYPRMSTFYLDAGLVKTFLNNRKESYLRNIDMSVSVTNAAGSNLEPNSLAELPSLLRTGISIGFDVFKRPESEHPMNTFVVEYQDAINGSIWSGVNIGFESMLFDLVSLRIGYFDHKINDNPETTEKTKISDFTYGGGVNLPLRKIFGEDNPYTLKYDLIYKNQPLFTESNIFGIDEFVVHNLTLSWGLNK